MYPDQVTIEIFRHGQWQAAARLRPDHPEAGYQGSSQFEYLMPYALQHADPNGTANSGVSCRYPVDFDLHEEQRWPAFVLDILPSGFGRDQWLEKLDINNGPAADWPLLLHGTAFPPGNLRIAEAHANKDTGALVPRASGELVPMNHHEGFSREEVLARGEYFIEYAYQHGIYAAGASDVQGAAPKLLMTQDWAGRWHAEGRLADSEIQACWLLKRPRGRTVTDEKILKNEAAYMQVAKKVGLNVFAPLECLHNTLFVPRFDRLISSNREVQRLGMESLCSLAGVSDFRAVIAQDQLCKALIRHSSKPEDDLLEYIKRDVLNCVLGNKDNHARNTAVLKTDDGTVKLAPLFDFAPMYMDPEGIARVCRWESEAEIAGSPVWAIVLERLADFLPSPHDALHQYGAVIQRLPDIMREAGVDDGIIEHNLNAVTHHAEQLLTL